MANTQQSMQIEGIDELLDADFEERSNFGGLVLEETECMDDLFYEKIASSALALGKI